MPALKRSYDVANSDSDYATPLHRVRNMWQFANLVQWIYIFGKAAKIDDSIDVEVGSQYLYSSTFSTNRRAPVGYRERDTQAKFHDSPRCCTCPGEDGIIVPRHRVSFHSR
jgi:hypothetical protein